MGEWSSGGPESQNPVRDAVENSYRGVMSNIEELKADLHRANERKQDLEYEIEARQAEAKKLADWLRNNP